jgi:hypothetical protein
MTEARDEPGGLGFFRSFGGGLLTTCGLDHALFMAEDYLPNPARGADAS